MKKIGRLCVITDTAIQNRFTHYEIAQMAITGGADIIQFRDKKMGTREQLAVAQEIAALCKKNGVLFIVNDRVDIALFSEADGVHLGGEDLPVRQARKLMGSKKIIGGTAHNLAEAIAAEKDGADYLGYGHIFPTGSKMKTTSPAGVNKLREVCKIVKIPVFAVGGIDIDNVQSVMEAGAWGVAVIGAVVKSENPEEAVKQLHRKIYG
jgi:thiamine-phosphate pyrophosphorylase